MLGTILIVILVLALVGALPRWSHSREWGYAPTGGLGIVLFVVVVLLIALIVIANHTQSVVMPRNTKGSLYFAAE